MRPGGVRDALDDDGLDELGAGHGLRVQRGPEDGTVGAALALEGVLAALKEAVAAAGGVDGAALDAGDEAGLLGDGGEVGRGGDGGCGGCCHGGCVCFGVCFGDNVCCGGV